MVLEPVFDYLSAGDVSGAPQENAPGPHACSSDSETQQNSDSSKSPALQSDLRQAVFVRQGEYWTVGFSESVLRLRDIKGLGYIWRLLREPGRKFHALDLVQGTDQQSAAETQSGVRLVRLGARPAVLDNLGMHADGLGDAGEMLDEAAKAAYRRRLKELGEEIEEAKESANVERVSQAEDELDALKRELARAIGLRGRNRRAASAVERARVSVTRAIKDALRKIAQHDTEMGRFLTVTIRTGNFCSYDPDQPVLVSWRL